MADIDKLMKEKLERVKKGYQSCKNALCESCPYDYSKRPDDHYCDSSKMSDDAIKVIEYLEKKVEDQQERIDIMAADMPIHCKDCRRYDPLAETCRWMGGLISPEFYCGNAEPKGDDDDADTSD